MSFRPIDRKTWRLPGLPEGWAAVRRSDLGEDEKFSAIPLGVLGLTLDRLDAVAHQLAMDLCETVDIGAQRPSRNWGPLERQAYLRKVLSDMFQRGVVVMVEELEDPFFAPAMVSRSQKGNRRKEWRVGQVSERLFLVLRADVSWKERLFGGYAELHRICEVLFRPQSETAALEICGALGLQQSSRDGAAELRPRLELAIRAGELVLVREPSGGGSGADGSGADGVPPPARAAGAGSGSKTEPPSKHWVEFLVVDDETGEPIPGVTLKIQLPGGALANGTTDKAGKVRIDGTPEGECEVTCEIADCLLTDTYNFVSAE